MKKIIFTIMMMLFLLVATGCKKDTLLDLPDEKIQSLTVYTYDYETNKTTRNWSFHKDDMEVILDYLEDFSGDKQNTIDPKTLPKTLYGVELYGEKPYAILFAGDYAITQNGTYYKIDGATAAQICQSFAGDSDVSDSITYVLNHRYLSIQNGQWDTRYMTPSNRTKGPLTNITLTSTEPAITTETKNIALNILNNNLESIHFGSRFQIETLIANVWYPIDDMTHDNIQIAWTEELQVLDPSKTTDTNYTLEYYQPLPKGQYRLIKELNINDEMEYITYEFAIE